MQTTGFFKKALDPWHTVTHSERHMDLMKPEVNTLSDTTPLVSPVHAFELGILLRDSKLLLPHRLSSPHLIALCLRDPSLFQLSVQPSMARAAKICMEPSSQETDSHTQHRSVPEA